MADFIKKSHETNDEYAIRLYQNKTLYGLTVHEIGDLLNKATGQDFDESAYRKKYQPFIEGYHNGFESGYEQGLSQSVDEASLYIDDLRQEREKHYKAKRQLQDKLREYRGYLTTEARSENLRENLFEAIEDLNTNYPLFQAENVHISKTDRVGVLQISDWHFGEVIEDNINTYNMEIAKRRIGQLADQVIKYTKEMDLNKLIILNLGDLVAGNIRISARVMNETDIITQIIEISEVIAQFLAKIHLKTCIKVEFYSVLDNHSRVSANYNQHIEAESFARLIPWYLEGRFAKVEDVVIVENRINEIEEYDIGHFQIYGSDFLFVHGHNDKISTAISDISMLTKINPISIFMGHLHSNIEKEEFEIDLIVNPSLIGVGAYAKSIRKASKPRQKLNIYNKKEDGQVFRESLIFLEVE